MSRIRKLSDQDPYEFTDQPPNKLGKYFWHSQMNETDSSDDDSDSSDESDLLRGRFALSWDSIPENIKKKRFQGGRKRPPPEFRCESLAFTAEEFVHRRNEKLKKKKRDVKERPKEEAKAKKTVKRKKTARKESNSLEATTAQHVNAEDVSIVDLAETTDDEVDPKEPQMSDEELLIETDAFGSNGEPGAEAFEEEKTDDTNQNIFSIFGAGNQIADESDRDTDTESVINSPVMDALPPNNDGDRGGGLESQRLDESKTVESGYSGENESNDKQNEMESTTPIIQTDSPSTSMYESSDPVGDGYSVRQTLPDHPIINNSVDGDNAVPPLALIGEKDIMDVFSAGWDTGEVTFEISTREDLELLLQDLTAKLNEGKKVSGSYYITPTNIWNNAIPISDQEATSPSLENSFAIATCSGTVFNRVESFPFVNNGGEQDEQEQMEAPSIAVAQEQESDGIVNVNENDSLDSLDPNITMEYTVQEKTDDTDQSICSNDESSDDELYSATTGPMVLYLSGGSISETVIGRFQQIFGATIVPDFTPDVTHVLVMSDLENGRYLCCKRTMAYLRGVASGKFVVSGAWVDDCVAKEKLTNLAEFEIRGDTENSVLPPLKKRLASPLFVGMSAFLMDPFNTPNLKDNIRSMFVDAGGIVVDTLEEMKQQERTGKRCFIFIETLPSGNLPSHRKAELKSTYSQSGIPIVDADWVVASIAQWKPLSFEDHRVC